MKRFFCPTCNRFRRARKLPIIHNRDSETGIVTATCMPHTHGISRSASIRVENPIVRKTIVKSKPVAVPTAKKGKR